MSRNRKAPPHAVDLAGRLDGRRNYTDADIDAMIAAVGSLPRSSIEGWRATKDAKGLERVSVSRRDELAFRLESAAVLFAIARPLQGRPAASETASKIAVIRKAATTLRAALTSCSGADNGGFIGQVEIALQKPIHAWAAERGGYPDLFPDLVPIDWRTTDDSSVSHRDFLFDVALRRCVKAVDLLDWAARQAEAEVVRHIKQQRTGKDARNVGDEALNRFISDLMEIYCVIFEKEWPGVSRTPDDGSPDGGLPGGPLVRFIQAALGPIGIEMTDEGIVQRVRRLRSKKGGVKSIPENF